MGAARKIEVQHAQPQAQMMQSDDKVVYLQIATESEQACHLQANKDCADYEAFLERYGMCTKGFFE